MSFRKETVFTLNSENTEIVTNDLVKTAAFSLPENFTFDPNYLYLIVRAVSAGEYWGCNKNFDYFPEEELKKHGKTFLSAHVFKNHENKHIENAIGDVLTWSYDDDIHCIRLLIRIDRTVAPTVARGFERGFMTDVSMGCRIEHSLCSICGHKARTKEEYCTHIKNERGRIYGNGQKVYEINIAPKFHDISAVLNGAERSAKVVDLNIIKDQPSLKVAFESNDPAKLTKDHVGGVTDMIEKAASYNPFVPEYKPAPFYQPEIFPEREQSKIASISKLSDIQKEISGKVISRSVHDLKTDKEKAVSGLTPMFKLLYTKYLDGASCASIGNELRRIAYDNVLSDSTVFARFLEMSDYCGIEFSPMEIHNIYQALQGDKVTEPQSLLPETKEVLPSFGKELGRSFSESVPSLAEIIRVRRDISETPSERLGNQILSIIRPMFAERSMHREFLGPRVVRIVHHRIRPNYRNLSHFYPLMHKQASEDLDFAKKMWQAYENDRVDRYIFEMEREKTARESQEKTAMFRPRSFVGKSLLYGIPATMAYSAIQRSRIRQGKRVHPINRAIGENPGGAAMLQLLAAATLQSDGKDIAHDTIHGIKSIPKKFKSAVKYVKEASESAGLMNKIPQKTRDAFDFAATLMMDKRADLAEDVLEKVASDEKDLRNYLQLQNESVKIEIDKSIGFQEKLALSDPTNVEFVDAGIYSLVEKVAKDTFSQKNAKIEK